MSWTTWAPAAVNAMFAGFRSPMNDALLVRSFESIDNLPRDGKSFVHVEGTTLQPIRECPASTNCASRLKPATRSGS